MLDLLFGSHRPTGCIMFSKALILSTWHVILKLKTSHVQDKFQEHSVHIPLGGGFLLGSVVNWPMVD